MRLDYIIHCDEKTVNGIELFDTRKDPEDNQAKRKNTI